MTARSTSRFVEVTSPGMIALRAAEVPAAGPDDVVVRVRACGICGSDLTYVAAGGMPGRPGRPMRLGHEAAGEVVLTGERVRDVAIGDRVVINPMTDATNVIGNGGDQGALADHLLLRRAQVGRHFHRIPDSLPWEVAALNEPLAVALHLVNRSEAASEERVAVFGAGTIGLAAAVWLQLRGVREVAVIDVVPERLQRARALGIAVTIDAANQEVPARLAEVHGKTTDPVGRPAAGTDVYLDAAGSPAVIDTVLAASRGHARLVVAALHKAPVPVEFRQVLTKELTITAAMGYPTEVFEVTPQLVAHADRFAPLVTHLVGLDEIEHALDLARDPLAAGKVVVLTEPPATTRKAVTP